MKAKIIEKLINENGNTVAVFAVPGNASFDKGASYEISKSVEPKTVAGNKRLWAIMNSIARAVNKSTEQIYCELLMKCNVRSEVRYILDEELEKLQEEFRCVRILMKPDPRHLFVRIYFGVSKMNMDEVLFLIEAANRWCDKLGVRR